MTKHADQSTTAPQEVSAFKAWYARNKQRLAAERRERYRTDAEYRKKAKAARKRQIERKKALKPKLPKEYTHRFADVAKAIGVTPWRLRFWKNAGYFPYPFKHERAYWFTDNQVQLIAELVAFFDKHPQRNPQNEKKFQDTLAYIAVNW